MNLGHENSRGNVRHRRAHLSYMCRATTSRSLNLASQDPDKLSKECSRYVAFSYKGKITRGTHQRLAANSRVPRCQEAHLCQRPVVQADRLENWVGVWDRDITL
jgi:hypothetical protein